MDERVSKVESVGGGDDIKGRVWGEDDAKAAWAP